jgi:hypothetical protein
MGIIYAGYISEPGNNIAGENTIKVNATDEVSFSEKKIEEKAEIIFYIKQFAMAEPGRQSFLLKRLGGEWDRARHFPSY